MNDFKNILYLIIVFVILTLFLIYILYNELYNLKNWIKQLNNDKINKYKFYISFITFHIKNDFKELKENLIIILRNKNMVFMFVLTIPFIFYIIKFQVIIGCLFCIYYLFLFFLYYYTLKSDFIISCKETLLNTKHIYRYSFFNIILFIPKTKAFLFVYNFLNIWINGNIKKKEKIILFIILFIISFFIKIYILLIIGYSYLSILVTSNLVISYFETISWKYKTVKAKNQHIIINCLLDNKDSVGKADNMKIIIEGDLIIFNADKFIKFFLNKVNKADKLQKAFFSEKEIISKNFINGHFSWSISSPKNQNKNLTKNKTSSKQIKVFKEDNSFEKVDCSDKSYPRLDGKNKFDYLTRTYEINKETIIIDEIPKNMKIKMQNESKYVYNSIIDDKDKIVIYSENGKFYSKENLPTVKEYAEDNSMKISEKIKDLDEFEKANEKYLSSDEGKKEYEIFKNIIKGKKNPENLNDSSDNIPYEVF